MSRYYYMIRHDANEISFMEYESLQRLADEHYSGNIEKALADDEYVFDQEEYDEWTQSGGF